MAALGLLDEIDPMTDEAYAFALAQEARESQQGAAAEDAWFVSFHGSQFPGEARGCPRQLLYRMMDIPRSTGSYLFSSRRMQQIMDAGKDIEDRLVMKWYNAGYLLSPPPFDPWGHRQPQAVFESAPEWLTSTVDAITVPRNRDIMVPCEVKTKYADVLADMHMLIRGPDDKHIRQLKTQIGLVKEHYEREPIVVKRCHNSRRMAILVAVSEHDAELVCPEHRHARCLEEEEIRPPEYGYVYYASRDNPDDTHSFYVEHDEAHMRVGREKLIQTQQAFIANVLPQENFSDKRFAHPFGWLWGDEPCKWCDFGDECRIDNRRANERKKPIKLSESEAIETAKGIRPDYDFDLVRVAVAKRWGAMIPTSTEVQDEGVRSD